MVAPKYWQTKIINRILCVHCNKRGAENVKARKNTKCWCKCFLAHSLHKNWQQYLPKNLNHQHLHASWGFHPKSSSEATAVFVLRIHGRIRLEKPLDHGIVAFGCCDVQRCPTSGAAARGQATGRTQRNEGEKIRRKFGHLKSRSFGNCGHSKILPGLNEQCGFEDALMTSSWVKKAMWTRLAVKMLCGNFRKCSISRKTNMRAIGTQQNLKSVPYSRYCVYRVRGLTHKWTGKT